MKPALVYNKNLELLGAIHNWRTSVALGEMSHNCLLITDAYFSPYDILGKKCVECEGFYRCFPKLLVKLPDKEEV